MTTEQGSRWERGTKFVILLSALASVAFPAWYSAVSHPYLARTLLFGLPLAYVAGRYAPETTAGIVVAVGYAVPTVLIRITGFQGAFLSVWTALLLGAMAGRATPSWQLPPRFRVPIVMWGLAVGLTWPIVVLRELNWNPSVLVAAPVTRDPAVHGVSIALYVSSIAGAQLVGMLWIDWLYGRFARHGARLFERRIIWPLVIAAVGAGAFATYQGFVDLEYPRQSLWAFIGRASGALDDANASAALAALWAAIPIALTLDARAAVSLTGWALSGLLLVGMWQTGSRSAMLCALIAFAGVMHIIFRRSRRPSLVAAVLIAVAMLGALIAPAFFRATTSNPLSRMREFQHLLDTRGAVELAREFWRRNGYGSAATAMIRDEPAHGVGVGTFTVLSADYAKIATGTALPTDNAQNWARHQIAELGLLGALGPLWWACLLVLVLFAGRVAPIDRDRATIVKYAIVGFGVISMVGVPSQNLFVAMAMWTMCGWLLLFVADDPRVRNGARGRGWLYASAVVVAASVAFLTYESGWRELRPPFRAKRFGYPYTAGLYSPMDEPVGTTVTARRAITVLAARTGLLKLTLWVEHPDADQAPVRVEVWVDNTRVVRSRFGRNVPLTRYVNVRAGERFVLETRVDRTFAAPERGQPEVGLNVTWHFVESGAGDPGTSGSLR